MIFTYRLAITTMSGKVLEDYYFQRACDARVHFDVLISEKKHKPSMIILFNEEEMVEYTGYIKTNGK